MHNYSTDSKERWLVPFIITVISLLTVYGIDQVLKFTHISLSIYIELPGPLGFYWIYMYLVDHHLWKYNWFRHVLGLKVPDLNGQWRGYAKSSFDNHKTKYPLLISIIQTWSSVNIISNQKDSISNSESASILLDDTRGPKLNYVYFNKPKSHALKTMHAHQGACALYLKKIRDTMLLDGEYFTGRDRTTNGEMHLKHISA